MTEDVHLRQILHGSEEYRSELELRNRILRIPLGLDILDDDLTKEDNDIHLGAFTGGRLAGTLVLTPLNESELKMRQVAVDDEFQNRGIGKKLVEWSEKFAGENGYRKIVMHARDSAVPFYEKLGYSKEGGLFLEVTIPHYTLYKVIV